MSDVQSNPPEYRATVDRLSDMERRLAVEIPWECVRGRLEEAYRELSHGVAIKGFRRGKVPRTMLERLFGEQVNKEVAHRLVQDSMPSALDEQSLSPVVEPKINEEEITDGSVFRYSAVVEVVPEIELADYNGIELTQRPAVVSDEDAEAALKAKQREATEYKPIEGRKTRKGDVLLVDVMGKVGDKPVSWENEVVELSDDAHQHIPGLADRLLNIDPTPGQDLQIEFTTRAHHHAEDGSGVDEGPPLPARVLVTVRDAKEKFVPDLDDEFAKDTGEAQSLAELREKLKGQLLKEDERRARRETQEKLVDELLVRNQIPAIPGLVERSLESMLHVHATLLGGTHEHDGELKEQLRPRAERIVRSTLLLEAIAKKELVEVNDEDLDRHFAEQAGGDSKHAAKARAEYEKRGKLAQLQKIVREEKTLELLLSRANIAIKAEEAKANATTEEDTAKREASEKEAQSSAG